MSEHSGGAAEQGGTGHDAPLSETVAAVLSDGEEELDAALMKIVLGLIGLAFALLVAEVLSRFARSTSDRIARRHPVLAELGWQARHRH